MASNAHEVAARLKKARNLAADLLTSIQAEPDITVSQGVTDRLGGKFGEDVQAETRRVIDEQRGIPCSDETWTIAYELVRWFVEGENFGKVNGIELAFTNPNEAALVLLDDALATALRR